MPTFARFGMVSLSDFTTQWPCKIMKLRIGSRWLRLLSAEPEGVQVPSGMKGSGFFLGTSARRWAQSFLSTQNLTLTGLCCYCVSGAVATLKGPPHPFPRQAVLLLLPFPSSCHQTSLPSRLFPPSFPTASYTWVPQ